jgi:hypothetical protein
MSEVGLQSMLAWDLGTEGPLAAVLSSSAEGGLTRLAGLGLWGKACA